MQEMQILILSGAELRSQPTVSPKVHSHRYKIFVDKLGWTALRRPNNLEIDAFDTDDAIHFIVIDATETILSYSRLLATTRPNLLANVYPHLLRGNALPPCSPQVWEWTRTTAIPVPTTPRNAAFEVVGLSFSITPAGRLLFLSIIDWALSNGISTLSLQCNPTFAAVVSAFGGKAEVPALPSVTAEGEEVVPIFMHLTERMPMVMRTLFGAVEKSGEEAKALL